MAPSVRLSQRLLSKVQPSVWHFQPPGGMDGGLGTFERTRLTARFFCMISIWSATARFIEYHLVQRLCMLGLDKRLSVPGASSYTNFPIQHLPFLFSPSLQGNNFKQRRKCSLFPQTPHLFFLLNPLQNFSTCINLRLSGRGYGSPYSSHR